MRTHSVQAEEKGEARLEERSIWQVPRGGLFEVLLMGYRPLKEGGMKPAEMAKGKALEADT